MHKSTKNKYINFGDFSRNALGMQCQYGSYYLLGLAGYPNLSHGLRIKGDPTRNYHAVEIHKDDAEILHQRIEKWRKEQLGE